MRRNFWAWLLAAGALLVWGASEGSWKAGHGGIVSTRMVVEKVYKGGLKPGEVLNFGQGSGGGGCTWSFGEEVVGERFLIYTQQPKSGQVLYIIGCNRSRDLARARRPALPRQPRTDARADAPLGHPQVLRSRVRWRRRRPEAARGRR